MFCDVGVNKNKKRKGRLRAVSRAKRERHQNDHASGGTRQLRVHALPSLI